MITKELLQKLNHVELPEIIFRSPKFFIETFLYIENKSGEVKPFILNDAQSHYYHELMAKYWKPYKKVNNAWYFRFQGIREVILKPRQMGLSTFISAVFYYDTVLHQGTKTRIYCQDYSYSSKMLTKYKLYYNESPEYLKPIATADSGGKLGFGNILSSITAEKPGVGKHTARKQGRSETIQNLHCSEFAEWMDAKTTFQGLIEAVPETGNIFIESSPKMIGDFFHVMYESSKKENSQWKDRFWAWFDFAEYTIELTLNQIEVIKTNLEPDEQELVEKFQLTFGQIEWRRRKIKAKLSYNDFIHEYPENDYECFETETELFFPNELRKITCSERLPIYKPETEKLFKIPNIHCIGVDVGSGAKRSNPSSITVIDAILLEQIFNWSGRVDPELLASDVYEVWKIYPGLVGIEANSLGLATLKAAQKFPDMLPFLFANNKTFGGWLTTAATKNPTLYEMRASIRNAVNEDPGLKLSSLGIIKEMNWFQDLGGGKLGAPESGKTEDGESLTDDNILSCMIAFGMLPYIYQAEKIFKNLFKKPKDKK